MEYVQLFGVKYSCQKKWHTEPVPQWIYACMSTGLFHVVHVVQWVHMPCYLPVLLRISELIKSLCRGVVGVWYYRMCMRALNCSATRHCKRVLLLVSPQQILAVATYFFLPEQLNHIENVGAVSCRLWSGQFWFLGPCIVIGGGGARERSLGVRSLRGCEDTVVRRCFLYKRGGGVPSCPRSNRVFRPRGAEETSCGHRSICLGSGTRYPGPASGLSPYLMQVRSTGLWITPPHTHITRGHQGHPRVPTECPVAANRTPARVLGGRRVSQRTPMGRGGGGAERHTPAPKWRVLRTPTSGGPPRGVQRAPGEAGRGQRGDKRQRGHEPPPARESAPVQTGTPERATRGEARASEHGSIVRPRGQRLWPR